MTARVSTNGAHGVLQALVLENELLRTMVLPELGGKLWQLTGQRTGQEFLWHNAQLQPGQVPFGATHDDNFFGGWDELFPNDVPRNSLELLETTVLSVGGARVPELRTW